MAKSADSERSRPTLSRVGPWQSDLRGGGGGDTHPPTRLGLQSPLSDSARLQPDSGSGSGMTEQPEELDLP
ncbi:hypothetical protein Taro_016798 [Colocasia esculenta]|uniref:Uncharacterized protein n=1 Tax=Colocasia esculenta TaxID=4460 RepID=A0A843URE0_COLES|nr:hypothetical protein [Colocasia esculenta]